MPPGSASKPVASISRDAPSMRSAMLAMRPWRMPISARNSSLAVTIVPPRIARSNCVTRTASRWVLQDWHFKDSPPTRQYSRIGTCEQHRSPQRDRDGIENQYVEFAFQSSRNRSSLQIRAKDHDSVAPVCGNSTDHGGDLGGSYPSERKIIAQTQ